MTREIKSWLTDMDGVLVHEGKAIPGAPEFVKKLRDLERPFLILTNNSIFTPRDLRARLAATGIEVPEESIWTSALATAQFCAQQIPNGSAYAIGEAGLTTALYEAGYVLTDTDPDYVVLGETRTYSFEAITRAVRPNPMMFRSALNRIDAHSETTAMIGDRMDTDVVAGIEAGLQTYLVLTGSTLAEEVDSFPFRPSHIRDSIADLIDLI